MADEPGAIAALETTPWGQCLNEICDTIIAADLAGIAGNVWIRDPPVTQDIPLPCVVISPFQPSHSPDSGTSSQPDLVVRVMVGIIKAGGGVVNATLAERLEWYDAVFRAFSKRSGLFDLDGDAADVHMLYTTVEPGDPRIIEAWQVGIDGEWLAVACHLRYPSAA